MLTEHHGKNIWHHAALGNFIFDKVALGFANVQSPSLQQNKMSCRSNAHRRDFSQDVHKIISIILARISAPYAMDEMKSTKSVTSETGTNLRSRQTFHYADWVDAG
jgi:hypothetical protein